MRSQARKTALARWRALLDALNVSDKATVIALRDYIPEFRLVMTPRWRTAKGDEHGQAQGMD